VICDGVFLLIDSATKTGRENDGTGALFIGYQKHPSPRVWLLDYDLVQIEGSLLEHWLPGMIKLGEDLADRVRARMGFCGALIEDKSSGMILLQQAQRRGIAARPIDSLLTALGKEERAINVSGYVFRKQVKFTKPCWNKIVRFKGQSANHLRKQVVGFRIGQKDVVEDDLLDCFCYGVALMLGDASGV
jgi:hypothetical protein